jgi:hypothetical protein
MLRFTALTLFQTRKRAHVKTTGERRFVEEVAVAQSMYYTVDHQNRVRINTKYVTQVNR